MFRLRIFLVFSVISLLMFDASAAPRKRRTTSRKPTFAWVKDNSRLFTTQQAEELNTMITSLKDSIKLLPNIYVVTQNNYATKSPYFRAFQSTTTDGKWYISETKEYADDFVILVRPRSRTVTDPQLDILYSKNSSTINRFMSSVKIDQLQNEYNKYMVDTPNSAQSDVLKKLIYTLRSRFFDGQIRDYNNVVSLQDEKEIARLIKSFVDKTALKIAVVTTKNKDEEDSVFGRDLMQKSETKDKQAKMFVDYKKLNADLVFVFYPKGVHVFSQVDKEKLSEKAVQNLISKYTLPQAKSGQYKEAMKTSLTALSNHLSDETPLDGMSIWEKLAATLLGVGIPAAFCWFIFKDSFKKGKKKASNSKPITNKPIVNKPTVDKKPIQPRVSKPIVKPEKKEERSQAKPINTTVVDVPAKILPLLRLSKPSGEEKDRGWTLDNTGSLSVVMNRIDDLFKPISPRNEHEKVMLEMIDYLRLLREYTDKEIAYSLGIGGVSLYLDELYGSVDPAAVRVVFNRGLDLLIKNYAERDPRVSKYVSTTRY